MVFKIPEDDDPEMKLSPGRKIPTPIGTPVKKPAPRRTPDPRRQQALKKKMTAHELHMHHVNHVQHMKNKMNFKPR